MLSDDQVKSINNSAPALQNTEIGSAIQTLQSDVETLQTELADSQIFEVEGSLTAGTGTTGGATLSLLNPAGVPIIVDEFIVTVATKSTGAATIDFGVAANGTTSSDLLLDGLNAETVATSTIGVNGGTNGKYGRVVSASQYITGTPSASTVGMVATYKLRYYKV